MRTVYIRSTTFTSTSPNPKTYKFFFCLGLLTDLLIKRAVVPKYLQFQHGVSITPSNRSNKQCTLLARDYSSENAFANAAAFKTLLNKDRPFESIHFICFATLAAIAFLLLASKAPRHVNVRPFISCTTSQKGNGGQVLAKNTHVFYTYVLSIHLSSRSVLGYSLNIKRAAVKKHE